MKVAILSGSVYGTAEEVARHAQKLLSAAGLEASHLPRASLDELKAFAPEAFLVVTSTTGMGELPDNLQPLYYAIRDQLPAWHGLPGGVIGLGDSSYGDTFCGGGEQVRELFGELADSPFLLYQQSFTLNDRLLRACLEAGFSPREGGRSGQADFLGALVAANQGVVLLPRVIAREIERPGVVRVLLKEPDLRWDIAFIWRRGGYLSRAAQAWLELLREQPLEESPA